MLNFQTIPLFLPQRLRGDFAFYPILILLTSAIIIFIIGLLRGRKTYIPGIKNEIPDSNYNIIQIAGILQAGCMASILFSAFFYDYSNVRPGQIQWEIGSGPAIVAVLALSIAAAMLFIAINRILFSIGQYTASLFAFLNGRNFTPGCMVVQTVQKHSKNPGPRAKQIRPEKHGDYIDYVVDKFRRIVSVNAEQVILLTKDGKLLRLKTSDPLLRKPHLFERVKHYDKFPIRKMAQEASGVFLSAGNFKN